MTSTATTICLICNQKTKILIKSHVLPKWYYKSYLKDNNNKYISIFPTEKVVAQKNTKVERQAKMSCKSCEDSFTECDNWLKNFFATENDRQITYHSSHNIEGSEIIESDINDAKSYSLSLLLRELGYQKANNEPYDQEKLDTMLALYKKSPSQLRLSILIDPNFTDKGRSLYCPPTYIEDSCFFRLNEYCFCIKSDLPDISKINGIMPVLPQKMANRRWEQDKEMINSATNYNVIIKSAPKAKREKEKGLLKQKT